MTSKKEAIKQADDTILDLTKKGFIIQNYRVKKSVCFEANGGGGAQDYMFKFDPPKPEFENGTAGWAWNTDSDTRTIVLNKSTDKHWGYHCYTEKYYDIMVPDSDEEFDNFAPLPIYAELEKYKRALEIMSADLVDTDCCFHTERGKVDHYLSLAKKEASK